MEDILWLMPYFLVSLEISLLAGTVGAYIYTRQLSGIVGGLSHFVLGPIGISYLIAYLIGKSFNTVMLSMLFMIVVALFLPIDNKKRERAENEIQVLWSIGMALGLLIMFLLPGYLNLDIFLFGSLLTISRQSIILLSVVSLLVLVTEFLFHNRFKYLGVDDEFTISRGVNTNLFHRMQLIIIVITITVLLESIGILMMIAILTLPTAIASLLVRQYRTLIVLSITIAIVGLFLGISMSYVLNLQMSSITTLIIGLAYFCVRIIRGRKHK